MRIMLYAHCALMHETFYTFFSFKQILNNKIISNMIRTNFPLSKGALAKKNICFCIFFHLRTLDFQGDDPSPSPLASVKIARF